MLTRQQATTLLNQFKEAGYSDLEVRRRANAADEQWIEILKINGKVLRVFTSVESAEKFLSRKSNRP